NVGFEHGINLGTRMQTRQNLSNVLNRKSLSNYANAY
ncbi:hydroxymethylglutaryl-CoA lyase, partial [Acinetobacter baumannii]